MTSVRTFRTKFFSLVGGGLILLSAIPSLACSSFPAGVGVNDLVMEFLPDGSGFLRQGTMTSVGTPREGMVVFDSSDAFLKVCDGTNWKKLDLASGAGSGTLAAAWGRGRIYLGSLDAGDTNSTPQRFNSVNYASGVWSDVALGYYYSCAILKSDSRLFCWGRNDAGQLGVGTVTDSSTPLPLSSAGGWNKMAWKSVSTGRVNGSNHTCAIRSDDRIYCWGYNPFGQLGDGTTTNRSAPVSLSATGGWDTTAWKSLSVGANHTCAIRASDDRIFCWGYNSAGGLGDGTTTNSNVPVALSATGGWDATAWKKVSVGSSFTCAIRSSDDRIFCWGYGSNGRMGTGALTNSSIPVALSSTGGWNTTAWKSLASGDSSACAVRSSDDRLFCWGGNVNGQLGTGNTTESSVPVALSSTGGWNTMTWKSVSIFSGHACAVRLSDNLIFCWGYNGNGQLGNGTTTSSNVPVGLSATGGWDSTTWGKIWVGGSHTCAIRLSDEFVRCWGLNTYGQLGTGTVTNSSTPGALQAMEVFGAASWKNISAGNLHACALRSSDSQAFCWGANTTGQLGDGTTTDSSYPVALSSVGGWNTTAWKSISAGNSHTCAIRSSDDAIFCWGSGGSGRLGNGATANSSTPVALSSTGGWDTTAWKSVASGNTHTCAIRSSDNQIFCWGGNANGQMGTGNTTSSNVPVALSSTGGWATTSWKSVVVGNVSTCAIRTSDSRIFCWGANFTGQLGTGNSSDSNVPVALSSMGGWSTTAWKSVIITYTHTCAIRTSDNGIFCWGTNTNGQLGNGNNTNSNVPVALSSTGGWSTTAWKSVATGYSHTCALRLSDNGLFCWGLNTYGQLGDGTITSSNIPVSLVSTDAWNAKAWGDLSAGGFASFAIEVDPNDCSSFSATNFPANDLVVQFPAQSGKTRVGKRSAHSAPFAGTLAFDRTALAAKVCRSGSWAPFSLTTGASCSSYPAGTTASQRVLEWVADGDGKTFSSNTVLRATPRQGSMIYNSTLKSLQICDGTTWQTLTTSP